MDFQQERYAKGAAGYDERIRKTFLSTKQFTQQSTPCFVSTWDLKASS
jgi:hypothetical protein